jgi:hypothetical protein
MRLLHVNLVMGVAARTAGTPALGNLTLTMLNIEGSSQPARAARGYHPLPIEGGHDLSTTQWQAPLRAFHSLNAVWWGGAGPLGVVPTPPSRTPVAAAFHRLARFHAPVCWRGSRSHAQACWRGSRPHAQVCRVVGKCAHVFYEARVEALKNWKDVLPHSRA